MIPVLIGLGLLTLIGCESEEETPQTQKPTAQPPAEPEHAADCEAVKRTFQNRYPQVEAKALYYDEDQPYCNLTVKRAAELTADGLTLNGSCDTFVNTDLKGRIQGLPGLQSNPLVTYCRYTVHGDYTPSPAQTTYDKNYWAKRYNEACGQISISADWDVCHLTQHDNLITEEYRGPAEEMARMVRDGECSVTCSTPVEDPVLKAEFAGHTFDKGICFMAYNTDLWGRLAQTNGLSILTGCYYNQMVF